MGNFLDAIKDKWIENCYEVSELYQLYADIVLWLFLPNALCCTNMYCFLNDCYLCLLFQTEGPLYWTTMALHILSPAKWKERRVKLLDRCMVLAQTRHVTPGGTKTYANLKVISHRNFKKKKITLH